MKIDLESIKKSHSEHLARKDGTAMVLVWELKYLVEQAERVHEQADLLRKYRDALRFYAKDEYYEPFRDEDVGRSDAFNLIDLDAGETAKDALNG